MSQEGELQKDAISPENLPPEHHRHILKRVILGTLLFIGIVVVLNVIFFAVGFRSGFFHRWAEGQEAGTVTEVRSDGFTIVGRNGVEKMVLINEGTLIKSEREVVGIGAVRPGFQVIIIGVSQGDAVIEARTIRIFQDDDTARTPPF